jgi:hypothetical protein
MISQAIYIHNIEIIGLFKQKTRFTRINQGTYIVFGVTTYNNNKYYRGVVLVLTVFYVTHSDD